MKAPDQRYESGQGEREDFILFFTDNYPALCFFARRFVRDKATAEDIVSESFVRIWEKWAGFSYTSGLRSYLYKTVYNSCLRWIEQVKKRGRESGSEIITDTSTYLETMIHAETLQHIHSAMNELPKECKKIFIKLYVEGKSVKEIAEELSLSVSTVKSQKARGLILLRDKLSPLCWAFLLSLPLFF